MSTTSPLDREEGRTKTNSPPARPRVVLQISPCNRKSHSQRTPDMRPRRLLGTPLRSTTHDQIFTLPTASLTVSNTPGTGFVSSALILCQHEKGYFIISNLWREKTPQNLLKFPKFLMTPDPYDFVGVGGQWTQTSSHTHTPLHNPPPAYCPWAQTHTPLTHTPHTLRHACLLTTRTHTHMQTPHT